MAGASTSGTSSRWCFSAGPAPSPGRAREGASRPVHGRGGGGARGAGVRSQHRLRGSRPGAHRIRGPATAPGASASSATPRESGSRSKRRRCAGCSCSAPIRSPAATRGSPGADRRAPRPSQSRCPAAGAEPGFGGRERRSRSSRASRAALDRKGRARGPGRKHAGAGGSRRDWPGAPGPGGEGGARAHQRHPGDDLAALHRRPEGPPSGTRRGPDRRDVHRCAARHRHRLRRAHPRVASPSGPAAKRPQHVVADAGLRDPGVAPARRCPHSGSLQHTLRTAGARSGARSPRRHHGQGRGGDERGDRQPARLPRGRARSSPEATFTERRWPLPPICSRWA